MPASVVAVAGAVALAAFLGRVGADARWLAALGAVVADRREVPTGIPFASAPSADWPNVLVIAELLFHWLHAFGDRGLFAVHLVAVGIGFSLLALAARQRGASDSATAVVLLLVVLGAATSIVVIRLQLFSLALFPLVLLLLQLETREPSRRIWLLPPLFALWGNLHGAVLIGVAVAVAYLALCRARTQPLTALAVAGASMLALLATPALAETADYYRGVLTNEAAQRGVGLWAPLSLRSPFDLVFLVIAAALLALALHARPNLWELAAAAGLALLTVRTARSGVWLLFTLAAPAARGLPVVRTPRPLVAGAAAATMAAIALFGFARGPLPTGASPRVVDAAVDASAGTPILAEALLAEQVALAGGRIWMGNPLDAFPRRDQRLYLDWLRGAPSGDAAFTRAPRVILVRRESVSEQRMLRRIRVRELARDENAVVYLRESR